MLDQHQAETLAAIREALARIRNARYEEDMRRPPVLNYGGIDIDLQPGDEPSLENWLRKTQRGPGIMDQEPGGKLAISPPHDEMFLRFQEAKFKKELEALLRTTSGRPAPAQVPRVLDLSSPGDSLSRVSNRPGAVQMQSTQRK